MSKPLLQGKIRVPGDKSITHRALIFSAFSKGQSTIRGISPADDCRSTRLCLEVLGLRFVQGENKEDLVVESPGLKMLVAPLGTLFCGNSGTTMRLLSGLVSGLAHKFTFDGDNSLRARPMARVLAILQSMGAQVSYQAKAGLAPFTISGGNLEGADISLPVASAQVQTAILLAGLSAAGKTRVVLPLPVRDHTERMFKFLGIPYEQVAPLSVQVCRLDDAIKPFSLDIPADISSAAFFMVAAALMPGSRAELLQVGLNPGRRLVVDVLKSMGADIEINNLRQSSAEPVADITVSYTGRLKGATVDGLTIAQGIDEIPVLALAGAFCDGIFSVRGAGELRVKESDRLKAIVTNMKGLGADITEQPDGFDITGRANLKGGSIFQTYGDHRLAMTGIIAGYLCDFEVSVDDASCVGVSYPGFVQDLEKLLKL